MKQNIFSEKQAIFIDYLLKYSLEKKENLPSINQIGNDLGLSTPCIREQIELARNLGLIQIQPRRGITILPYKFTPAVTKSLYYAIESNIDYFNQYSLLRNQLEKSFFNEAVNLLNKKDLDDIKTIVENAVEKLSGSPIQIPHQEHRSFHLKIYEKLENVFVKGLLESYWDVYELIGLDLFTDMSYLEKVWNYHGLIAKSIINKGYLKAYKLLEDHMNLIFEREQIS
jgi:DNA-binding FadR family transcriptional regulator